MGVAIAGIAAAALGAGATAYGASQQPGAPRYRPAKDVSRNQAAINTGLPFQYQTQNLYGPAFAGAGVNAAATGLFGTPGGMQQNIYPIFNTRGKKTGERAVQESVAGSPGLLDLYEAAQPRLEDLYFGGASRERARMVQDLGMYGPQLQDALADTEPERFAYNQLLRGYGAEQLGMGSQLGQRERGDILRNVRSAQAARGFGRGPSDVYQEALALGLGGQQLQQQRQAFALNAGQLANQGDRNPLELLFGRQSAAGELGPAAVNRSFLFGQSTQPEIPLYGSIGRGGTGQGNAATANTLGALGGGLLGLSGQLGGQYFANQGQQQPRPVNYNSGMTGGNFYDFG